MRYSDLNIETYRHAPARARTEGEALLIRAGYIHHEGRLTQLGRRFAARIEELTETRPVGQVFAVLGLPVVAATGGQYYFRIEQGRDDITVCPSCGYAAPQPLAAFRKPEPSAEEPLPTEKMLTPECHTIEALAKFLGIGKEKTAKALMYTRNHDNKFVFVVVRGDMQLSEAKLKQHHG